MKNTIYLLIIIAFSITQFSCDKDLLNLKNPNYITTEEFWQTSEDAIKGVNAVYAALQRKGTYKRWLYFVYDIRSDEGTSNSPWADLSNVSKFTFTDYNFEVNKEIWQDHYRGIYRANQVLRYVPNISMDEEIKDRILSEASFLRALYYFNLAILYGNVPIVLIPNQDLQNLPSYSTEKQVWEQIIKDLKFAKNNLPERYSGKDIGRVTQGAAIALLGKAYMQNHRYNEAIEEFRLIYNKYSLVENYEDNFLNTRENNEESIFEVQFSDIYQGTTDQDGTANSELGCNRPIFLSPYGWSDGEATEWLKNQFFKEKNKDDRIDARIYATLIYKPEEGSEDETYLNNQTLYDSPYMNVVGNGDKIWLKKFLNTNDPTITNATKEPWNSPNNIRVIRYADILLLYAEALNEIDRTSEAYQYIDEVRTRANMSPLSTGLDKQAMFEQIQHERIVELAGESQRFIDLKRWGMLSKELEENDPEFKHFVEGKSELLPIPTSELDLNHNLKQNPGW